MKRTYFSSVFGCRVNEAEREIIDRNLTKAGFCFSRSMPALYIINTCAVTAKAEREARQHIYQARKRFPKTKIIVTGCSATYWQMQGMDKKLPIDLLVDNTNKQHLVDLVLKEFYKPAAIMQSTILKDDKDNKFLRSGRAMIKIQDGCQRYCTYCIVPYLRGKPRSFLIKDIVGEINSLKNICEVILTAINTEAFGFDSGENLIDLVDQVLKQTNIKKISFGSIHPWSIDKKFVDYYKKLATKKRFSSFFHIPLQSGSDKILRLMKRNYTTEEFAWKISQIKKINPFALVATDVIVGFLGESDRDFDDTYRFLEKTPIDRFHVFRFSNREKTASWHMKKRLSEAPSNVKVTRAKAISSLGRKKYQNFLKKLVKVKYQSPALFLDKFQNGYQQALLENQVLVLAKTNKNLTGQIKNVKVEEISKNLLVTKIL